MRRSLSLVALSFLVGGAIGYMLAGPPLFTSPSFPFEGQTAQETNPPMAEVRSASLQDSPGDEVNGSRQNAITRAVASVSPAVVGINIISVRQYRRWSPWGDDPFFRQFFGDQIYTQPVQSLGSGFLVSSDGYILTNDHVAGNANEITVTMTSGEKYEAQLVGSDPLSDVALLKIDGKNLPSLRLGDSDGVIIGEWAIAFGNPFGLFDISDKPTVTVGVVSATNMNLRTKDGHAYRMMIQTDASINSGNSGGPLVNSVGEVIGLNSVIYTPNEGSVGVGFSIPINRVKAIMDELKRNGRVDRNFNTGLEVQVVDGRVARYFGLESVEGVIVSDVRAGSAGDKGGFKPGDIILEVQGETIDSEATLVSIMDLAKSGEFLRVKVWRNRDLVELKLKLERKST